MLSARYQDVRSVMAEGIIEIRGVYNLSRIEIRWLASKT